jgi:hypothetical protein
MITESARMESQYGTSLPTLLKSSTDRASYLVEIRENDADHNGPDVLPNRDQHHKLNNVLHGTY